MNEHYLKSFGCSFWWQKSRQQLELCDLQSLTFELDCGATGRAGGPSMKAYARMAISLVALLHNQNTRYSLSLYIYTYYIYIMYL